MQERQPVKVDEFLDKESPPLFLSLSVRVSGKIQGLTDSEVSYPSWDVIARQCFVHRRMKI